MKQVQLYRFEYYGNQDFIAQLDAKIQELGNIQLEDYVTVRKRYPQHTASAFTMRLKRFMNAGGQFPHTYGSKGKRIQRMFVTPALNRWLEK